jgi:PPOX class probable F420-dependent enzyme
MVQEPPEAAKELLALRPIATLATMNADGTVHLVLIWYLYDPDDGRLYLSTGSASRKARNAGARPQGTVLVDQRPPAGHRWVSAAGSLDVVRGETARAINARIRGRYLTEDGEAAYGPRLAAWDDVALALTPETWRSWTLSNLGDIAAERGLPAGSIPDWFLPLD